MPNNNIDTEVILAPLKELSHIHGGNFYIHNGMPDQPPRGYWLIFESLNHLPGGTLTRSSQIHYSWAMTPGMQQRPIQMRTLPYYSMSYFIKGKGRYIDLNHPKGIAMSAGSLVCKFPGQPHIYAPDPETRWDEININFSGEVFNGWVGPNLMDPMQPVRRLEPVDYWLKQFHNLVLPLAKPGRIPSITDTGKLTDLISRMCKAWQTPWQDHDIQWLEQAQQHLHQWPLDQPLNLETLARKFNITEQTYRKKFKRLCSMTPSAFRTRYLIELACQRLRNSDVPLKQIAEELGYGNEYYFMRRFKQIAGVTPGNYRRKAMSG